MRLRPLLPGDAEAMARVLSDPALYEFTGGRALSAQEWGTRLEHLNAGDPTGTDAWWNLGILISGGEEPELAGYVQATVHFAHADVAWVIGVPWQRRGIATQAVRELIVNLFAGGVSVVDAHIHKEHLASQRLAQSLDFVATGECDDHNEMIWRLVKTDEST